MFLAGDFGLIRDVLTGLEVRQEKIDEIMVMLGEHSDTLQGTEVTEVPATWFGGSPTGHHRLGSNAAMARDEVRKEFLAMAEGLRAYREAVRDFARDVTAADETTTQSMANIERGVACTGASGPDDGPAMACTAPGETSGGQ